MYSFSLPHPFVILLSTERELLVVKWVAAGPRMARKLLGVLLGGILRSLDQLKPAGVCFKRYSNHQNFSTRLVQSHMKITLHYKQQ